MSLSPPQSGYHLGEFTLDPAARRLLREGEPVPITKRPFQVLLYLIEHRDRVVTREELFERFWDGRDVYDEALSKSVGAIRKALGDSAETPRFVETRYGEGYRYIGPVDPPAVEAAEVEIESVQGLKLVIEDVADRDDTSAMGDGTHAVRALVVSRRTIAIAVLSVAAVAVAVAFGGFRERAPAIPPPPAPAIDSIAVLPLKNFSASEEDAYFSDGLTESLITELARVNGLKVISRNSAFAFKDRDVDPSEVGERLGVAAFLEGSVYTDGRNTRVQIRLVSTKTGEVLWTGDSFDRSLGDVLDIQDGIVCQVVSELKIRICGEGERPGRRYTENPAAFRAYLKGRYHWNRRYAADMKLAIEAYQRAIADDPSYALAHAALAETYAVMECNAQVLPGTVIEDAARHARTAIELDPALPGGYAALGLIEQARWNWAESERLLRQALDLNPEYVPARYWLANQLTVVGRFKEAEQALFDARRIDPLSIPISSSLAELYGYSREYDKLLAHAEALRRQNPADPWPYSLLMAAYCEQGRYVEALEALERSGKSPCESPRLLFRMGRAREGRHCVEQASRSEFAKRAPYSIACYWATAGEPERAFEWLDKALAARQPNLISLKVDPAFDSIRPDPRFARYLAAVGLAAP